MFILNKIVIVLAVLCSSASAFFLNWGSANQEPAPPYPAYYYHQRLLQSPPFTEPPIAALPSIPVQVPLQAQVSPAAVHNVQLVPCLCPVSQDYDYDKAPQELIVNNQHKIK